AALAEGIQPSLRSVRAVPARVRRLRALVHRPHLPARAGAGDRGATHRELSRISAASAARQLLGRAGNGEAEAPTVDELRGNHAFSSALSHEPSGSNFDLDAVARLARTAPDASGIGADTPVREPIAFMERWGRKEGDPRLREHHHRSGQLEF